MEINSKEWKEMLKSNAEQLGFFLNEYKIESLRIFVSELTYVNTRFNLTAITDPHELIFKHILDSFVPSRYISNDASVLDIGTGGGFPGIPLKILNPTIFLTLIDSSRKKINFIKYIIRKLILTNISAIQERLEFYKINDNSKKKFDVAISRAAMSLSVLLQYADPLITNTGMIIAMKGGEKIVQAELANLKKQMKLLKNSNQNKQYNIQIEPYRLKLNDNDQYLVLLTKVP
jgi:16S rRNA (guanine527-N7)-methyltransferase